MKDMLEKEELAKIQDNLEKLNHLRVDFDKISKERPWAL